MFQDCQTWRQTVEGVGIDELYQQIDPWDVRSTYILPSHTWLIYPQFPERRAVFDCWPNWSVLLPRDSTPYPPHTGSTRYLRPCIAHQSTNLPSDRQERPSGQFPRIRQHESSQTLQGMHPRETLAVHYRQRRVPPARSGTCSVKGSQQTHQHHRHNRGFERLWVCIIDK